jgi:XTP/dITP diphosphohydrolase
LKKILIATNNSNKLLEIGRILDSPNLEIVSPEQEEINIEPEEDGITFEENALIKARAFKKLTSLPVAADDSGITVDALGGLPGVRSKRFAGPEGDDEANNRHLIELLEKSGTDDYKASFVCVVAYIDEKGDENTFRGECKGEIVKIPRGVNGFGYDPHFYVPELKKTTAQMDENEKNSISHRGKAFGKLCEHLLKEGLR